MRQIVVILLSDKRSGSTMFEDELCRHSAIKHVDYTPHSYAETHYWLMAACLLKMPEDQFAKGKRYPGYGPLKAVRIKLVDLIRGNVPSFVAPEDNKELVTAGWNALCRHYAKPVFFEKSPQHPHHKAALSLLAEWAKTTDEFEVKFISLVRNPMSVMYSAQQLFATDPEKRQYDWALAYRNIATLMDELGRDRFHAVRYEDLIASPDAVLAEACRFIGVDYEDSLGSEVHGRSIAKWLDDPWFTLQLDVDVVNLAKDFGYSEAELYNPPKPGMPFFRKLLRRMSSDIMQMKSRLYDRYVKTILLTTTRRK